jgi:hypothetical protein
VKFEEVRDPTGDQTAENSEYPIDPEDVHSVNNLNSRPLREGCKLHYLDIGLAEDLLSAFAIRIRDRTVKR